MVSTHNDQLIKLARNTLFKNNKIRSLHKKRGILLMNKFFFISLAFITLTGCAQPVPQSEVKAHFETEASARKMMPKEGISILYLIPTGDFNILPIYINGSRQASVWGSRTGIKEFYAFCLPPGRHEIQYSGEKEYITVTAGEIIVRELEDIRDFIIIFERHRLKVREMDTSKAKSFIEARKFGPTPDFVGNYSIYQSSEYRCRFN